MKTIETKHLIAILGTLTLVFSGCASNSSKPEAQQAAQQIEAPKTVAGPDKDLYSQALKAQNAGQFESAIKLWQNFLSKNPDSFEGHNNLGLVYYTQDMVEQALQEFETAHRLEPNDPRIRQNLARALRFKASMVQESRDYFKTLKILARLEKIVEPEEKQGILFKQEQVEDQIFLQVIKANNSEAYQDFVNRFPDGLNAVRAREYLEEHPYKASRSTSKNKTSKSITKGRSWISSGKVNKNPSDGASWASAEQPPDYSASRPSATYTPPAPGTKKKKEGDFFGTDSAAVEQIAEENVGAAQEMDPVVPFEDFEKPERSSEEQVTAQESNKGKESLRAAGEFNPTRDESTEGAAGLDTLPDLEPSQVASVPAEMDAPQPTDMATGDIKMQPAEQEPVEAVTAPVEETVEQSKQEEPEIESVESESDRIAQILKEEIPQAETAQPEPAQSEPVQEMEVEPQTIPEEKPVEEASVSQEVESAAPESVESESDRIARVVREQIAAENAASEQAQPEPVQEEPEPVQEEPEPFQKMAEEPQAIPEEKPVEVASVDPETQDAKPEMIPAESPPVEGETPAPAPEEKKELSQKTLSETVAALVPSLPQTKVAEEIPVETVDSPTKMVVIQMKAGATLNVRAKPSTQGEILGYLENDDMMPFMSESGDWYQIEIDEGLSGWVSKKFSNIRSVTATEASLPEPEDDMGSELAPAAEQSQTSGATTGAMVLVTVREGSTLNVRSLPSSSGAVVDMLFGGDKLPFVKEENGWYQVQFEDETTGWISKKFSVIEGGAPVASAPKKVAVSQPKSKTAPWAPKEKESNEMVTTVVVIKVPEGSSLNVRSAPSSQGQVLGSLKRGDMRPLLEEKGEWFQVKLQDGQAGWVSQKFSGKMNLDTSFLQDP
jgi:uncharacterized protein YgiM (DUF1202 family)